MSNIILLKLDLTNAPSGNIHRYCTAMHDVLYGGYLWKAVGNLLKIDDIEQTVEIATLGTTVTLSGIEIEYQNELDNNGFVNAPITIYSAELGDNTNVVNSVTILHSGRCNTPSTDIDYATNTITLAVATESIWGDLDKTPSLARCSFSSHSSQHRTDINGAMVPDETFKYVASTTTEEKWFKKQ